MSEWKAIITAPEGERVLVAGWQGPRHGVRGYWWWHEDVVYDSIAVDHPDATMWAPVKVPPFPECPE